MVAPSKHQFVVVVGGWSLLRGVFYEGDHCIPFFHQQQHNACFTKCYIIEHQTIPTNQTKENMLLGIETFTFNTKSKHSVSIHLTKKITRNYKTSLPQLHHGPLPGRFMVTYTLPMVSHSHCILHVLNTYYMALTRPDCKPWPNLTVSPHTKTHTVSMYMYLKYICSIHVGLYMYHQHSLP